MQSSILNHQQQTYKKKKKEKKKGIPEPWRTKSTCPVSKTVLLLLAPKSWDVIAKQQSLVWVPNNAQTNPEEKIHLHVTHLSPPKIKFHDAEIALPDEHASKGRKKKKITHPTLHIISLVTWLRREKKHVAGRSAFNFPMRPWKPFFFFLDGCVQPCNGKWLDKILFYFFWVDWPVPSSAPFIACAGALCGTWR